MQDTQTQPSEVKAIYDNKGKSYDRYTIAYKDKQPGTNLYWMVSASANPQSPFGFFQHGAGRLGPHLGKKIKWTTLPIDVRLAVIRDLQEV